jgi:urease subunit alpha
LRYWGIVKAYVGVVAGRIAAIGKAGNPDVQPNASRSVPTSKAYALR